MTKVHEFTADDLAALAARGISAEEAHAQLALLRNPPEALVLDRPCIVGDGIVQVEAADAERLIAVGREAAAAGRVTKFVPASGAATRMFKELIAVASSDGRPSADSAARELFDALDRFPFGEQVRERSGVAGAPASEVEERRILTVLLDEMGYGTLPKGLIPFHRVGRPRTAFEEHLLEGTRVLRSGSGRCRMHFTVAPDVRSLFEAALQRLAPDIEAQQGVSLHVTFSEQLPSTDTLALDDAGCPFRDDDGTLLLRPAGHGALLRNLEQIGSDLVVIKNIDNIVPHEAGETVARWKHLLIGLLARTQADVFAHLDACRGPRRSAEALHEAAAFAAERFGRRPAAQTQTLEDNCRFVVEALDRPLRVCGVVSNEGEPGGAPFWVRGDDGTVSPQIVESAQVNTADQGQRELFASATHFNPVDVVCAVRDREGNPYPLERFVDPSAVFLSTKSFNGRALRALERPGLWNGAMAGWNTIFVEVPAATFAPVKSVFDLLRPPHCGALHSG